MRDGDPFLFWLVQHPSSAAGHRTTAIGMARLQFSPNSGVPPNHENKTGFGPFGPLALVRALKLRPWPGLACLLSSWFSYGQGGREREIKASSAPCELLTLRHSSPRKCPGGGHGIGAPSSSAPDGGRCVAQGRDSSASTVTLVRGQRSAFFFPAVLV